MMVSLAVCDDDIALTGVIEDIIEAEYEGIIAVESFSSGNKLLDRIEGRSFQIYLMDIEMPGRSGIETASAIRRGDPSAVIVFVTDHKEYVFKVFEVLPFRFIQKPVTADKLIPVLRDALVHIKKENQLFFFKIGHEARQLPCHEILYFEGAGRKVRIHTADEAVEYYERISQVPAQLDPELFTQIHASYIINMEYIRAIRPEEVVLSGGIHLSVSKKYRTNLKLSHLSFLKRRGGIT